MENLKVLGKEKVADFEFTGIEGGFGKDKKAMLVKDIAKIHNSTVKRVNELINRNRKQFIDDVDIIDLKAMENFKVVLNDLNFSSKEISNSNNIYLLSERGYLKLLKIMDDDKAWDIYNDIVDNYFNMRVAIKEKKPEIVEPSRLSIMEKNATTRRGRELLKLTEMTDNKDLKERALFKAFQEMSGETFLPDLKERTYTATDIAKEANVTPMRVGMVANRLNLKATKPLSNKYGKWVKNKAQHSNREVAQWIYFEKGRQAVIRELGRNKQIY